MANAFSILVSGEQPSQNASKNKKKKNKSKQKTTADEGAPAVSTETVLAETTRTEEVVELADAVPILEKSARTQGPNRIKLWKDWQRQVGAGQAGCAGRQAGCRFSHPPASVGCMLMWAPAVLLQATDRSPKALKYRAPDGSLIQFKEVSWQCQPVVPTQPTASFSDRLLTKRVLAGAVPLHNHACLSFASASTDASYACPAPGQPVCPSQPTQLVLRSRALEIAVEGCIASPLSSDETYSLQQLLSTFLPRTDTSALAAAISRLSELLAEDSQSFDTVGAAQRAVHNVISTLKAAKDGSEAAAGKPATLQVRSSPLLCWPCFQLSPDYQQRCPRQSRPAVGHLVGLQTLQQDVLCMPASYKRALRKHTVTATALAATSFLGAVNAEPSPGLLFCPRPAATLPFFPCRTACPRLSVRPASSTASWPVWRSWLHRSMSQSAHPPHPASPGEQALCWGQAGNVCRTPVLACPAGGMHAASVLQEACTPPAAAARLELQRRLVCRGTVAAVCRGAQLFSDGSEKRSPPCLS